MNQVALLGTTTHIKPLHQLTPDELIAAAKLRRPQRAVPAILKLVQDSQTRNTVDGTLENSTVHIPLGAEIQKVVDSASTRTSNVSLPNSNFSTKTFFSENAELHAELFYFREQYPSFAELFDMLEVVEGTNRAEFNRKQDLAVGYLRSVRDDDYTRWNQIYSLEWNWVNLIHFEVPKEFYVVIQKIADTLRQEAPEKERTPLEIQQIQYADRFLSKPEGHPTMGARMFQLTDIGVSREFITEQLTPLAINHLIQTNPWAVGKDMRTGKLAEHLLQGMESALGTSMNEKQKKNNSEEEIQFDVHPKLFLKDLEELISLSMDLFHGQYKEVSAKLFEMHAPDAQKKYPYISFFIPYIRHMGEMLCNERYFQQGHRSEGFIRLQEFFRRRYKIVRHIVQ